MLESFGIKLFLILFMMIVNSNQEKANLQGIVSDLPGLKSGGQVLIKQTENSPAKTAALKDIIFQNGLIATGKNKDSIAELTVTNNNNKAVIRIANNTYFKLNPNAQETKINLTEGKVLVQKSGNMNLNVYVGNYIAATEGTTYTVEASRKKGSNNNQVEASIKVYEGLVMFLNKGDSVDKGKFILPGEKAQFVFDEFLKKNKGKNIVDYKLNKFSSDATKLSLDDPIFKNSQNLIKDNLNEIRNNIFLQDNNKLDKLNTKKRQELITFTKDFVSSGKVNSPDNQVSYSMDKQILSIIRNNSQAQSQANPEANHSINSNVDESFYSNKKEILNNDEIYNKVDVAIKQNINNSGKTHKEKQDDKIDSYRKFDKLLKSI